MKYNRIKGHILTEDCAIYGEKMYFMARDYNMLCEYDLKKDKTRIISHIPEKGMEAYRLATSISVCDGNVVLAPTNMEKIWIFNIEKSIWRSLEIEDRKVERNKFFVSIQHKNKIYMVGSFYPSILEVDIHDNTVKNLDDIFEGRFEASREMKDSFFRYNYVQKDNKIFLASCISNEVLEFDMENREYEWHRIGKKQNRFSGIGWDGKRWWLAPRNNGALGIWDQMNYEEINLPENNGEKYSFTGIVCFAGNVYLPAMENEYTLIVDKNSDIKMRKERYTFAKKINEEQMICQNINGDMYIITKDCKKTKINNTIDISKLNTYLQEFDKTVVNWLAEKVYMEDCFLDLEDIINILKD